VGSAAHRAGVGCGKGERVRNWRIISTIAAVVFAAAAGVLVWKYLSNADSRAEKKTELVPVLVAKQKIARGTVFDTVLADKLYEESQIPRDSVPPGQISPGSDRDLLTLYKGKVATTDIYPGTPLVNDEFVQSSQLVSTVAGAIPKGSQAITVSLDSTHAVGGFVTPGDTVSVLVTLTVKDETSPVGAGANTTAFLLPSLKVLAVGSSTVLPNQSNATTAAATSSGSTPTTQPQNQPPNLITLEVTPRQAEQIVQGQAAGSLYLSLNPPDFKPGEFQHPDEIVDAVNLFNQPLAVVQQVLSQIKSQG
jgi:pilus assembly protein CpaB